MNSLFIKRILIAFIIVFPSIAIFGEEQTIYLRNGQILRGEVIQQTAMSMQIRTADGKTRQLNKTEIQKVTYKEPSAKELKEAEEKLKQQAQNEKPIEIIPEQKTEAPKKADFSLDPTKRHDIEFFAGLGYGYYKPNSENFLIDAQNRLNIAFGSRPSITEKPSYKAGLSDQFGLNYTFKKFSGSLSGSHFRGTTTTNFLSLNSGSEFNTIGGTYPEKQSSLRTDISYLAFSNNRFDLRPTLGYSQFWGNTDDKSTSIKAFSSSGLYLYGQYFFDINEQLKGPSAGLKATIRIGERIENRIELHSLQLNGTQDLTIHATVFPDSGSPIYGEFAQSISWKAKGVYFDYKFVYKLTPVFSIWAGIASYDWKYSLDRYSLEQRYAFEAPASSTDFAIFQGLVQEQIVKGATSTSKSNAIQFGVMYRLDLGRSNISSDTK
ncbi:LA_0442/LA_0875 N-terminal domain-containing protein [Leptospira sarikeiensis]|uniref:Uncharacterized protein n=1 Tax=Leptospira sarikeiensis TaxID=2484943 RepID=A0A4R9KAI8_9LEPT|nr:hypothetical protein [Leptospira sarikeiensis]TGL63707.1 hypothetical protein EHQ64_07105 [Leptospira sarikeiensis]